MSDEKPTTAPDPKEQMKAALEAKKAAAHARDAKSEASGRVTGGPHGQVGGKRVFRRKSGG